MQGYNQPYWDKKINKYLREDWSRRPTPLATELMKYLKKDMKILELGTGAGNDALAFAGHGANVIATDAQATFFKEITQRAGADDLSIDVQQIDLFNRLPYRDSQFDVVYAHLVLHYFDDSTMHKVIDEITRVLRKDGLMAILTNCTKPQLSRHLSIE